MESPLWVLRNLLILASYCVQEALEYSPISSPGYQGSPEQPLPPGPGQRWVRGDCGVLNSWILHSEVSFLGRASSPKSSIFICVWQWSAGVGKPKGTDWASE